MSETLSTAAKRLAFTSACLGILIFGIVMAILGALLPSIIVKFGMEMSKAGSLFMVMTFGMLGGSVLFGPLADRFGYRWILVISALLIALGFYGISEAGGMVALVVALLGIGLGGGVVNGGTNSLVADIYPENRGGGLSLLGVFFGVGAFGTPFLLGSLLDLYTYEALMYALAGTMVLPLIFFALVRYPEPKQAEGFPVREALALTREKPLLLFGVILFMQSGMEMTMGGWTSTYLDQEIGMKGSRAVLYLSFYWAGMMVARTGLGKLLGSIGSYKILYGSLSISLAGAILMIAASSQTLAITGITLLGVGLAAGFPVILGLVGDRYAHLSGTAFSLVLTIGLTGGMILPWFVGVLADLFSIRVALGVLPLLLLLVFFLLGRVRHSMDQ
ncbi:MAG: MFS transporter [Bacteroidota bacterium]